jgi:CysZ protein
MGGARCPPAGRVLAPLWTNYERRASVLARQGVSDAQLEQFRWLLEELRVQLFAQELRTPVPVSSKRLQKMWEGHVNPAHAWAWTRLAAVVRAGAVALVIWIALMVFALESLIATLVEQPPMTWLAGWGAVWLAKLGAVLGGWLLILAAAFVTAMLLAAIFVMPLLLNHVALADYPELARVGKDSVVAGGLEQCRCAAAVHCRHAADPAAMAGARAGLVLPILWMAWLTRRTFAFDALTVHATDQEWRALRREHGIPLLVLGVTLALLAHIPLLGLLTPTLAALAYSHYCLEALRGLRQGALVAVIDEQPKIEEVK